MGSSDGYFPRGESLLRDVMRERAVNLLYGQRALMVGALQPVAFIGTTRRSTAHNHPWRRLVHTAEMFDAVFFGSTDEADKALRFTHRLHERVRGTIGVQAGPHGPDTPYDALDPELMLWVTAPVFDSARVLYEALVRPLGTDEREQLYRESVRWGELFGMPPEVMPPTYAEFRTWWPAKLAAPSTFLTDQARSVGLAIGTRPPAPTALRPAMRVAGFVVVGSLPPSVRDAYGLSWRRRDEAAYRSLTAAVRAGRPLVPGRVRRGSSSELYHVLERTERARAQRGKHSFGSVA
jgi:uncharacterized protein (DUF2236 family)